MSKIFASTACTREDFLEVAAHAGVETRYFVRPLNELMQLGSFAERNAIFARDGLALAVRAVTRCLHNADVTPADIAGVIFVSSTGFAVPSLDVALLQQMQFPANTRRWPVFGWGCFGGVAALQLAFDYTRAHPTQRILICCVELCSLAFQSRDLGKKAMIANSIFNDGAAAALVEGASVARQNLSGVSPASDLYLRAPRIVATHSHLFPATTHLMGWEQRDTGFQVILSPDIPDVVLREGAAFLDALLRNAAIERAAVRSLLVHPGGAKVLRALEESVGATADVAPFSWQVLAQFGNMSSCSILFVLEKFLAAERMSGAHAVLAFGPGFSAEGIVLTC